MNPLLIYQFSGYQQDQWKVLQDHLHFDEAFRHINIVFRDRIKNAHHKIFNELPDGTVTKGTGFFNSDKKLLKLDEIQDYYRESDYDYAIFTGRSDRWAREVAKVTKLKKLYVVHHSISGCPYSMWVSNPTGMAKSVGLFPEYWMGFDHYKDHMSEVNNKNSFIPIKSHPIMIQLLSELPKVEVNPKRIGLIMANSDSNLEISRLIIQLKKDYPDYEIVIRKHPLDARDLSKEALSKSIFNHGSSNKYDFTDSCSIIGGSSSSLLAESIIRNNLYGLNQSFFQFTEDMTINGTGNSKRIFDMKGLPDINEFNINKTYTTGMYDGFINFSDSLDQTISYFKDVFNSIK